MVEKKILNSIWESNSASKNHLFVIQESSENEKSEVDGVHILAKVAGPAFFPNTISRNRIHYPLEAWENAIAAEEFQERLRKRLVFGTIGHDPDITDNEVRAGLFSHIVTKVWIDEETKIGMAEYLVLNTEPGRILNTLLRSGVKISVSTKAYGETLPKKYGQDYDVVDPDNFEFDRIDMVIDPGYKQASPKLIESKQQEYNNSEDIKMTDTAVRLEESFKALVEANKLSNTEVKELQKAITEAKVAEAKAQTELDAYKSIGTVAAINETYKALADYRSLGDFKTLKESMEEGEETLEELTAKVEELEHENEELKAKLEESEGEEENPYAGLGSPEEISSSLESVDKLVQENEEYKELGETPEELRDLIQTAAELVEELEEYRALGTAEEIKETLDEINKFHEDAEAEELTQLAEDLGVEEDTIAVLKEKGLSVEDIKDVLETVKPVEGSAEVEIEENEGEDEEVNPSETPAETDEDEEVQTYSESLSSAALRNLSRVKKFKESKKQSKTTVKKGRSISESVKASSSLLSRLIK